MKAEEFKKVQEIANSLSATLKSLKLYKEGHIVQEQMINRLFSFFQEFFKIRDILEMEIDNEGLKYEGKLLLSAKDVENDFIFNLYKDGIRYIAFCEGLIEKELKNFFVLLTKSHPGDQDISTLLWEERFSFIKFARIEAFYSFFKKEDEKFLQEEAQKYIEEMKKTNIILWENLRIKEEEGEDFNVFEKKENILDYLEKEKENSIEELISNLLNSLNSQRKEIVQLSAKNLRTLSNMILEEADLDLLRQLIFLLPEDSEIKEVQELKKYLTSDANLNLISSKIFLNREPSHKSFGFFLNVLPDDRALNFLVFVFNRNKDFLYPIFKGLYFFREKLFLDFLLNIPQEEGAEILNYLGEIKDELKIKIFNTNKNKLQQIILKKLEKPIYEILINGLNSEEKEIRLLSIEKILRFKVKELLNNLIEEIEKEKFLKREKEEKEKWIIAIAILGKDSLEDYFLNYFQRKTIIFSFIPEERKYWATIALKILGTKKSLPYLKNELRKAKFSTKLREALKHAIEEIEKREK